MADQEPDGAHVMARHLWMRLEPLHAAAYYSPESAEEYGLAGLKGWAAYIAARSAPLGQVPAAVVTAGFFNFAPALIQRHVPSCWSACTPEQAWSARLRGADRTLRRLLGPESVEGSTVEEAALIARRAAVAAAPDGRALFAAHLELDWPREHHLVLWQAATLLREHRGDGHSAAAVAHGLSGLEAHVTHAVATGLTSRRIVTARRGWSDDDWDQALLRLQGRGLLDESGELTAEGRAVRDSVEDATDRAAWGAWECVAIEEQERLAGLAGALSGSVVAGGGLPAENALGLPRWWDARG